MNNVTDLRESSDVANISSNNLSVADICGYVAAGTLLTITLYTLFLLVKQKIECCYQAPRVVPLPDRGNIIVPPAVVGAPYANIVVNNSQLGDSHP
jgi:hypothetical protein